MHVNKINAINTSNIQFGKIKKTDKQEKKQKQPIKNGKKLLFALGAMALTGAVIVAIKKPNLSAEINKLKSRLENIPQDKKKIALGATAIVGTGAAAGTVIVKDDKKQAETSEKEIIQTNLEDKQKNAETNNAEVQNTDKIADITAEAVRVNEKQNNSMMSLTLDEFKKAKGEFWKGGAYIDEDPYTGDIIIDKGRDKINISYDDGYLVKATTMEKMSDGSYEPKEIKTYKVGKNGSTIIEIKKRKYNISNGNNKFSDIWYTDQQIKINDTEVTIKNHTQFGDFLETHFKEQKDGSWQGYYEERVFNPKTQIYEIGQFDYETHNRLTKRQFKKFFE